MKSPSFLRLIESNIKSRFQNQIELGSLSFSETNGIIIHDLTIIGVDGRKPLLIIPYAEVEISLSGLVHKSVDAVTIKEPKVFINLQKEKEDHEAKETKPRISLPFTVKKGSLESGEFILQLAEDLTYHLNAVTLLLDEDASGGPARIKGDAFFSDFNSTISFEAAMDMKTLNLQRGHLDIGSIELETLLVNHVGVLKDKEIEGSIQLSADMVMAEEGMDAQFKGGIESLRVRGGGGGVSFHEGSGEVSVHLTMTRGGPREIMWQSDLEIRDLLVSSENLNFNSMEKPLRLLSKGTYNLEEDHLNLEFLRAHVKPLQPWSLQGALRDVASGNPEMDLHLEAGAFPLAEMKGFLTGPEVRWLNGVDMEGHGRAKVNLKGNLTSPMIQGVLSLDGKTLKREEVELGPFEITLPFEYSEQGTLIRKALVKGSGATFGSGKQEGMTFSLENLELAVSDFTALASRIQSRRLGIKAAKGVIYKNGKKYHTEHGISMTGALTGDLEKGELRFSNASLDMGSITKISADVLVNWRNQITLGAAMAYRNVDIEKVRAGCAPYFSALEGFGAKGTGEVSTFVEMTFPQGAPTRVTGRADVKLTEGGFSSPEADKVGEGIVMKLSGGFKFSLPVQRARFTLDAEASDFELLLGGFYGDFKDKILRLSAAGEYEMDTDVLNVSRADLDLTDIGSLRISGRVSNIKEEPVIDAEADLLRLSNKAAYDFFVRETFQLSYPFLSRLELDGLTTARLSARGSQGKYHLRGEIKFKNLDIRSKENQLNLTGINMLLPVDISYPEASRTEEMEEFGFLTLRRISWRALEITNVELLPSLWQNTFLVKDDITLPVFGGVVRLEDISYNDVLNPERRMRMSIDIHAVDLAEVSVALGLPRFSGSLSGTVPKVNYTASRLLTEGEVMLELFGGEVRVREMSANHLFSPIVSLHSTIKFKEIDLAKLTKTFEFGHVSGILQGSIEGLVITNGQAESFEAQVETVKRKNVDQRIDVKALEKITILGSGKSPSILGRGIYQLFKEYRYARMGFQCMLKNDNFELHGIEMEGNREYLVKGALLPPKVNVINYTRNISFREMVKRLKRIKQAGGGKKEESE